jgi:cytochrome P450
VVDDAEAPEHVSLGGRRRDPRVAITPRSRIGPPREWPLIPFSGGPAICPGRNLVLLLTSNLLRVLVDETRIRLETPERMDPEELPGTLNNYALRFEVND